MRQQTVVITGSTSGIGRGIALRLAREGNFNIILNYAANDQKAQETLQLCQAETEQVSLVKADVSRKADVERLMRTAIDLFGTLDGLVNNAAQVRDKSVLEMSEEEQQVLRVGLIGYGTIGQEVARLVAAHAAGEIVVVGALVRHARPPVPCPPIVTTQSALLAEQPHVVVEAAGHEGLREHGPAILRAGVDLLLVSTGALAEPAFLHEVLDEARTGGAQARVVSGAIGALDALTVDIDLTPYP